MSKAYYLALLAGMFLSSPALLWPHVTGPAVTGRSTRPLGTREAATKRSAGVSKEGRSQGAFRRSAEAAAQKAALLRAKQTARNLVAATKLFQESGRLFTAGRSFDEAAESYIQTGEIYSTVSQYNQARKSFRHALKLGNNPELQCRALSGIARTYASTGPYSLADRYSMHALSRCERLSEKAQGEALEARGEVLDSVGEHSKGADSFNRARELFAAANDDNGQAQALLMLAYALFSSGERAQGLQAAGQALRLWSSTENRLGVAQVRAALGIFAITTGEFETAQCDYSVARRLFHEIGDKDNEASVLNGLGYVNRETGDWQQSLKFYQKAKAAFASVQDLLGEQEAINGMGKALTATKNYRHLLPLYQAELGLGRQANNPVFVASALADIAGAYETANNYAQAEIYYRRSLEAYSAADHLYGKGDILIRLGHLQANQMKYSEAIASLEQANQLKEKTGQVEEVAKIQYELGCIYRRLNRLEDARSALEKTLAIIENQRATIAHFDSRATYFASVHRYYALYVQVLMLLHRREPELGFAEMAFDASERSKVRSLLDLLTTSSQEAPCDELLQRQLEIVDAAEAHLVSAKQTATSTPQTLTLKQVQAEISDDTVLLEYALGDDKSYVWAIDRHQITSHELPPAEQIRKMVERVRGTLPAPQLEDGESAALFQARVRELDHTYEFNARQLSEVLLRPIGLARAKRLLIVPDGSLQYIPFTALPLPGEEPSKGLLVNHYEIDVLPSASVLGTLRKSTATRVPPTAIAAIFADPVFEWDDPRVSNSREGGERSMQERPPALTRAVRDTGSPQYIARLPASRDEAVAIATILRSRDSQAVHIALDFDASRDYVLKEGLAQFRLIHFATHGVVDAQRPEMSGLILSLIDRRGKKQDGYLRLGDIYKLKLSADLVVLSSCDSALGKDLDSEGIIGLPRGFLYAGARSVIASLWKVNDEATARLMTGLYTRIQRGESPGSALRGAQLEMAREEQWSKPYYWAAFVLQGDYR